MPRVVRSFSAMLLACATLLAAPAAFALDTGDIIVVSSKGEVHITVNGAERNIRAGGVLELPASVRTGRDGNVELKQGATTVSVGAETLLEFPALEKRGGPIDRIVQPRGNAFYSIGKREGRKLRVETPYLVGVIKGTQFNVAAQEEGTTISLFEGLLEIRATGDSDVADLKAGEIASRKRGDMSISVIKMDAGVLPPAAPRPSPASGSNEGISSVGGDLLMHADTDLNADLRPGDSLSQSNDVDLAANGPVSVELPGADAPANIGVDTGPAAVDVVVDAGPVTADLGTSTSIDAGSLTTDVAANDTVDLGSGTVDAGVIVGASAPEVEVDVGAAAAGDAVAGTVNPGLDVLDTGIDVGVDLGLDDGNNGHGNDASGSDSSNPGNGSKNQGPGSVDVGTVLDGLLRQSGKK